mmetsp:Transcript_15746/g.37391  ORF Transcript_15746/g.37391 Transcript_15746/m.37391 type:complete len:312 (+) Transcript_15746:277-1212(+)
MARSQPPPRPRAERGLRAGDERLRAGRDVADDLFAVGGDVLDDARGVVLDERLVRGDVLFGVRDLGLDAGRDVTDGAAVVPLRDGGLRVRDRVFRDVLELRRLTLDLILYLRHVVADLILRLGHVVRDVAIDLRLRVRQRGLHRAGGAGRGARRGVRCRLRLLRLARDRLDRGGVLHGLARDRFDRGRVLHGLLRDRLDRGRVLRRRRLQRGDAVLDGRLLRSQMLNLRAAFRGAERRRRDAGAVVAVAREGERARDARGHAERADGDGLDRRRPAAAGTLLRRRPPLEERRVFVADDGGHGLVWCGGGGA